jgi:hypothetical protein
MAAKGGHLKVLKWLRANGCPWDEDMYEQAAARDDTEMMEWLHAKGWEEVSYDDSEDEEEDSENTDASEDDGDDDEDESESE